MTYAMFRRHTVCERKRWIMSLEGRRKVRVHGQISIQDFKKLGKRGTQAFVWTFLGY